jgi:formamidopyrimidine-DNA glycosylase
MRPVAPSIGCAEVPELPEVEATRRHLEPALVGSTILSVEVRRDRMVRRQERPADFAARVTDRRVDSLDRWGKFLLASLDQDITWVTHLGMSGRISIADPGSDEAPHTNVVVGTDAGHEIRMVDPRTFGFVAAYTPEELERSTISKLGPDALTALPGPEPLARRMAGRSIPVKVLLLDQAFVAGIGNIYADEILHRAGIDPHRAADTLDAAEVAALHDAVGPVLEGGLRHGGTSLGDLAYLLPDGRAGAYLDRLAAYGRTGEACRRCDGEIQRTVLRQRSTHWCRSCQR